MSSDPTTTPKPPSNRGKEGRVHRYLDVATLVLAAPVLLVADVPTVGYILGAATWILARGLGVATDHLGGSLARLAEQVSLRLTYRLLRVLLLVGVVVLGLRAFGRSDGTTALLVITAAFTMQLSLAVIHRQRRVGLDEFSAPQAYGDQPQQGRDHGQDDHTRLGRQERGRQRRRASRLPGR
jgi:hypothetical protein